MRKNSEWDTIINRCEDDHLLGMMIAMDGRTRKVNAHQLMQSAVYLMWHEGNFKQAEKMLNDLIKWLDKNAGYFKNLSDHLEAYYFLLEILLIRNKL